MERVLAERIVRLSVGLDYHQVGVQVCVLAPDGRVLANRSLPNDVGALMELAGRFGRPVQAAVEACCGAAALADALVQRGWAVHLAHPGYVRKMKQNPDKTDYSDARLLADLVRVGYLPRVWLAPPAIRDLRCLVRYRQQVVERRRAVKLRIRALLREHRVVGAARRLWTKAGLRWLAGLGLPPEARWVLDRHLEELCHENAAEARAVVRLRAAVAQDAVVARLLELPGIGLVTAAVLRAEIGQFDRFGSGKALAHYCGLSPRNASSGQRQADAGLVKTGHPLLRATLIQAAHRLSQRDLRWKAYRVALRARGKAGSVVAAAIGNRWIRWLYYQVLSTVPLPAA